MGTKNWNRLALGACLSLLAACGPGEGKEPAEPCGNGMLEPTLGEACDDGNNVAGDGCSPFCTLESSTTDEVCDDGVDNDENGQTDCDDPACAGDDACVPGAACGDGTVDDGEECDDGNTDGGDDCNADCTLPDPGVSGDGVVDDGEECDDGNTDNGDDCNADCTLPTAGVCGDGDVNTGEECDDGNIDDGDGCAADCTLEPFCGDGTVDAGEACDDGNDVDGDGCESDCTLTPSTVDCGAEADVYDFATDGTPLATGFSWSGSTNDWADDSSTVSGCTATGGADAVFTYTAEQTGFVRFSAANDANTADVSLLVFEAVCNAAENDACGEDSFGGDASVIASVVANTTYFVRVEANVDGDLTLTAERVNPPGVLGESCGGPAVCGPGLACVDGTCGALPGTCDAPLAIGDVLTGDWETGFSGTIGLQGLPAEQAGTCGGAGREVAIALGVPETIQVVVDVTTAGATAYVRNSCAVSSTEVGCGNDGSLSARVRSDRPAILVIDSEDPFVQEVTLSVSPLPLVGPGESCGDTLAGCTDGLECIEGVCRTEQGGLGDACDPLRGATACEAGANCVDTDDGGLCVLSDATGCGAAADLNALGTAGSVGVDATVPLGTAPTNAYLTTCGGYATAVATWTPTRSGAMIVRDIGGGSSTLSVLASRDECGNEATEVACSDEGDGSTELVLSIVAGEPVHVFLGGTGSAELRIWEAPERSEGEACDPLRRTGICAPGLVCGDEDTCEPDVPNSCVEPLLFGDAFEGGFRDEELTVDLLGTGTQESGSCGGAGNEAVVQFTPRVGGLATFEWSTDFGEPVLYARSTCGTEAEELACSSDAVEATIEVAVEARESIYLILDGSGVPSTGTLTGTLIPFSGEGEPCGASAACEPRFACIDDTCQDVGLGGLCDTQDDCGEGLACAWEAGELVGYCAIAGSAGEACTAGGCGDTLACDLEAGCVAGGVLAGEYCDTRNDTCRGGLVCNGRGSLRGEGVCAEAVEAEGACLDDSACEAGLFCDGASDDTAGVCSRFVVAEDGACTSTRACARGLVCVGIEVAAEGTCRPLRATEGACQPERPDACARDYRCVGAPGAATCQPL